MRGQIISYDARTRFGILVDQNGAQHRFPATEWLGKQAPQPGQPCEFNLIGASAVGVNPTGPAQAQAQAQGNRGGFGIPSSGDPVGGFVNSGMEALRGAQNPFGVPSGNGAPGFWHFYFSPSGRVSLGQYWRRFVLPFGFLGLLVAAGAFYCVYLGFHHQLQWSYVLIALGVLLFKITILGWVSFVMHIKRYHDLGMSWGSAWVVDNFMPYGRDWMTWRVLCQQGQQGDNQFGPDPRQWG